MLIQGHDDFMYAMMCLGANDELGVDTETSGLNVRNRVDYLMGFCFSVEGMECYMPFRHKERNLPLHYLDNIAELLEFKNLDWHNQKFDWHSIKTIGIDPLNFKGKQWDNLIVAHLIDEEAYSKELDVLGKKYLGEGKLDGDVIKGMGKSIGFENIPVEMYERYGPQDAVITRRLKPILERELVKQDLQGVYWNTEQPFTQLLYVLEQRGVGVNKDFAARKAELGRGRMATITRELGFNPASPIALGKYLLDELGLPVLAHTDSCRACKDGYEVHTHEGKASFNKKVMEDYDDILSESSNISARRVAEFRGWQKATTSLYEPVLHKTGPDGLIRTDFRQSKAVTGRLSAADPNMQQIPRGSNKPWNGDAKQCFWSGRPGFVLRGYDYSQLELRLGAAYGDERVLLDEFAKPDADPFRTLAPLIFGVFTDETRHDTKTFVYSNLFGAGLRKVAAQLGRPLDEVEELYRNYHDSIPGIMEVSKTVASLAANRGWIRYWDGRRRHFKFRSDSYKAWNSLLQGGGAQLVKRAMLRIREWEDDNCFMVLQVHDEITFAIREDMVHIYEPKIIQAMTEWDNEPELPKGLGVKMHVEGKDWK